MCELEFVWREVYASLSEVHHAGQRYHECSKILQAFVPSQQVLDNDRMAQEVEGKRHPAEGTPRKLEHVDMINGLHDNHEDKDADGEIACFIYLLLLSLIYFCI